MIILSGELSEKSDTNVLYLELHDAYTNVYMCTNASRSQKKKKKLEENSCEYLPDHKIRIF